MMQGNTISVGFTLPYKSLKDIIVVGIIVTPLVFSTKKVIMLRDAVSFLGFISCNDFIAFNPNGVAALPNPAILAIMLEAIKLNDSQDSGISGNSFPKSGDNFKDIL
jgi:hypothetical protein